MTSVRRAKTAGIFPNAIEIVAGGKKVIDAIGIPRLVVFLWKSRKDGGLGIISHAVLCGFGSISLLHFCPVMKLLSLLSTDGPNVVVISKAY